MLLTECQIQIVCAFHVPDAGEFGDVGKSTLLTMVLMFWTCRM